MNSDSGRCVSKAETYVPIIGVYSKTEKYDAIKGVSAKQKYFAILVLAGRSGDLQPTRFD